MTLPTNSGSVCEWKIPVCERCRHQPFRNAAGTDWLCECNPSEHGGHRPVSVRWITVIEKDAE